MGYYTGIGLCGLCDQTFTFNPERVPCFPLDGTRGGPMSLHRFNPKAPKQPVCKPCFDAINEWRIANDLPAHHHLPDAWEASETVG